VEDEPFRHMIQKTIDQTTSFEEPRQIFGREDIMYLF